MENTNTKLKIGFFNINGLVGETTFNPDFCDRINKYDIITLTETWHQNSECINKIKENFPKDYNLIDNPRKNRNKQTKLWRNACLLQKMPKKYIITLDKTSEDMIWIKLHTDKDLVEAIRRDCPDE